MLGWPKRCKLAHAFLWEYSCKRLKLAQLLGQLGVFLTRYAASAEVSAHPSGGVTGFAAISFERADRILA